MSVAAFGPGIAIVTRTDVSPSTPINAGYCQSLELSLKGSTKDLYGQNQFPILSARSTIKASGKLVSAVDSGIVFNSIFVGQTFSTGGIQWNIGEAHTPASGSSTVTNSATFDLDLGVVYASTGLPLTKVAATPATGQYSVSAGVYSTNSSDTAANAGLLITYSSTVTSGQTLLVVNEPIGFTPTFQLDYYTSVNQPTPKPLVFRVYSCIADSVTWSFKLEDFMMPSFDFDIFANAAGKVFEKVYPEVS